MKRYAVVAGYVRSSDGDLHWINARQLVHLYKVDLAECVLIEDTRGPNSRRPLPTNLTILNPRSDGRYNLSETVALKVQPKLVKDDSLEEWLKLLNDQIDDCDKCDGYVMVNADLVKFMDTKVKSLQKLLKG